MKYLLDTNVLRELGKATPHENVAAWLETVDDADLAVSALTVREIAKGVSRAEKDEAGSRGGSALVDPFKTLRKRSD